MTSATIFSILWLVGLVLIAIIRNKSKNKIMRGVGVINDINQSQSGNTRKIKKTKIDKNLYLGLRQRALTVTPDKLKLALPYDQIKVFGVIMDWDIGRAIATVVAFQTGDASVYLSTGQGFIGGYAHRNISEAAQNFVHNAQSYIEQSEKTRNFSGPAQDWVKFFLLTNKGVYVHEETMTDLKNYTTNWTKLFDDGNQIITAYRLFEEKIR